MNRQTSGKALYFCHTLVGTKETIATLGSAMTAWGFGTCLTFRMYWESRSPNWLILGGWIRGVKITKQKMNHGCTLFSDPFFLPTFLFGPIQPGFRSRKQGVGLESRLFRTQNGREDVPLKKMHSINLRSSEIDAPRFLVTPPFSTGPYWWHQLA